MNLDEKRLESIFLEMCSHDTTNPPGNEETLARFIGDILEEFGFSVDLQFVAEKRANLVAKLEQEAGAPYLMFSGHMDVVPASFGWKSDPFKPIVVEGKVFARGAADMKAGLASMLGAFVDLKTDVSFVGNVAFVATCDEEVDCSGIRTFLRESNMSIAGALIAEPTSLRMATGEKGAIWSKLTFMGKSAHGSRPQDGINAILLLYDAYREISERLRVIEGLTMSLNKVSGGSKENTVPDQASCILDIRFMSNSSTSEVIELINDVLSYFHGAKQELVLSRDPFSSSGRLTNFTSAVLKENGLESEALTMTYFTDGAFIAPAGIETIILGPGEASMAHRDNEHVELSEMHLSRKLYREIAKAFFEGRYRYE